MISKNFSLITILVLFYLKSILTHVCILPQPSSTSNPNDITNLTDEITITSNDDDVSANSTDPPAVSGAPPTRDGLGEYRQGFDLAQFFLEPSHDKKLVCYYGSWAVYRPDKGKFPVENIDPFICTHLIYTFAGLGADNKIRSLDSWNDLEDNWGKGAFKRFTNLKQVNPRLKTMIAIGGWNEGSQKYSMMASSPSARATFVESVVQFLELYNFDGLDLDWEYPAARGGAPEDKVNFAALVTELRRAFGNKYLLSAAVSAGKWFMDPGYDIPIMSRHLDMINVMAYDYHGGWEDKTGHNAPMYARPDEVGNERLNNVNFSINYWLEGGAAPEKIILGMGTYGRSFTLQRGEVNGLGAPAPQKGQAGPYTREGGSLGYNEICEAMMKESWTVVRDEWTMAPYAYHDRQWVGYDDMESIAVKTRYAKSMNLGGAMIWSIETDDFHGECHNYKFPLLTTINHILADGNSEKPTPDPNATPKPTQAPPSPSTQSWEKPWWEQTSSTTSTTTPTPSWMNPNPNQQPVNPNQQPASPNPNPDSNKPSASGAVCRGPGSFRNPNDCRKFYQCVASDTPGKYTIYEYNCPTGTVYDENNHNCAWPESVPECNKKDGGNAEQPTNDVGSGGGNK